MLGGRWRLQREIGRGGFGAVYKAVHVFTGQPAAVKVLTDAGDIASPAAVGLFLREGRLDNAVTAKADPHLRQGPGSVTVFDSSPGDPEHGDPPYLAMDLLEGQPLNKAVKRVRDRLGRVPAEVVVPMMEEALAGLSAAHKLGIVHRDVKPENLFHTRAGDTRVLDFGLAQVKGSKFEYSGPGLGTMAYAAPEQIAGEKVDARADVWGAAATLYAMLSGQLPAGRTANTSNATSGGSGGYPCPSVKPLRSVAPEVPDSVARVVDRGLACDPAERWQTAEAMRQALRRAVRVQPLLDEELAKMRSRRVSAR